MDRILMSIMCFLHSPKHIFILSLFCQHAVRLFRAHRKGRDGRELFEEVFISKWGSSVIRSFYFTLIVFIIMLAKTFYCVGLDWNKENKINCVVCSWDYRRWNDYLREKEEEESIRKMRIESDEALMRSEEALAHSKKELALRQERLARAMDKHRKAIELHLGDQ